MEIVDFKNSPRFPTDDTGDEEDLSEERLWIMKSTGSAGL